MSSSPRALSGLLFTLVACSGKSTMLDDVDDVDDAGDASELGDDADDTAELPTYDYDGPDGGESEGVVFVHDRVDGFAMYDIEMFGSADDQVMVTARVRNIGDEQRGHVSVEATAWDAEGHQIGEQASDSIDGFVCQSPSAHMAACLAPDEVGRVILGIGDAPATGWPRSGTGWRPPMAR